MTGSSVLKATIERIGASNRLFHALLWGYPSLVLGYWLLAENHGIFGDEGWHLMFLMDAWQKPASSVSRWLWNLYVFNDQYPPTFYLLSAPFYFLFDNHLTGARLFSASLAAIALAIFYRILRLYVERWFALLGLVLLFSSGMFVEATRYYLLEIGLLVWLLALYLLVAEYLRGASATKAAEMGAILALGLLTKPNFVIYAFPVGLLLLYGVAKRVRAGRLSRAQLVRHVALVTAPSLVLALPWYVVNLLNPGNLLITLRRVRPFGELVPVYDPLTMLRTTWAALPEFFPWFLYVALVACAAIVALTRWMPAKGMNIAPNDTARDRAVVFFSGYVIYLTTILFPLGLYYALRWNLSYALFVAALVCLIASLPSSPLRFAVAAFLAALSVIYTYNNFFRQFTASPLFTHARVWYWNPRSQPTGVEEVARIIDREERRARAPGDGTDMALLMQEAGGVHAGAANYYLRAIGSSLKSQAVGYSGNTVNVDFLTGSRYIVLPKTLANARDHPESFRNQAVAQRWLPRHPDVYVPLGRAYGRFGVFEIYKRVVPLIPVAAEEDLIRIGTELERGTAFEPFWKLAAFRLAVSGGHLAPGLERDLDAISAQIPSLQGQLAPPVFERLKYEVREARALQRAIDGMKKRPLTESIGSGGVDGSVDTVRRASQCMLVSGWVARADHAGPVRSILVVHDRTVLAEVDRFDDRPDVAKHFGVSALSQTGFTVCIPLEWMQSGSDSFELVARDSNGALHELAKRPIPRS